MEQDYFIYNMVDEKKTVECKDGIWSIDPWALIECYNVYKESGSLRPKLDEITSLLNDKSIYKTKLQAKATLECKSNVIKFVACIKRKSAHEINTLKQRGDKNKRANCVLKKDETEDQKNNRRNRNCYCLQRLVDYITTGNHPNNLDEETLQILKM